jgi:hypothetical protein
LALLVAGFGVMAAFALFPEALGQSRKSVEATEVATFADFVFAGLAARTNWDTFGLETLSSSNALDTTDPVTVKVDTPDAYQVFWWRPWYYGDAKSAYIAKYRVASFTYNLRVLPVGTMKGARLEVWAGEIPTPPPTPGKVFYRQFAPIR